MPDDPRAVQSATPSPDGEHPAAPETASPADPFDQFDDDALSRQAREHPRLKAVVDRETRTLLKQMEGRLEAERRQRQEAEQRQVEFRALEEKVQRGRQGDYDAISEVFGEFANQFDRNRIREEVIQDPSTREAMSAAFVAEIVASPAWQQLPAAAQRTVLGQPTPDAFLAAYAEALLADKVARRDHDELLKAEYQRGLDEGRGIRPGPDTNAGASGARGANGTTIEDQIGAVLGRVRERGGTMRPAERELLEALNAQLGARA